MGLGTSVGGRIWVGHAGEGQRQDPPGPAVPSCPGLTST